MKTVRRLRSRSAAEGTYMLVDLSGGDVVIAGQGQGQIPFVVPEIQIDFGTCTRTQYAAK